MQLRLLLLLAGLVYWCSAISQSFTEVNFKALQDSVVQLMETDQPEAALVIFEQTLTATRTADSLVNHLDMIKTLAKYYRSIGDFPSLFQIYHRGKREQLWRKPKNSKEGKALAWLYGQIAYAYDIMLGEYQKAVPAYEAAEQIFAAWNISDTSVARFIWWRLGNIHTRLGDNPAAAIKLEAVKKVMEEAGAEHWVAEVNNDLGLLYGSWGQTENARNAFLDGLNQQRVNADIQVLLLVNYSDLLVRLGEVDAAENQLLRAEKILLKVKAQGSREDSILASWIYRRQATIANLRADFVTAHQRIDSAFVMMTIFYGSTNRREFSKHYILDGIFYTKEGNYQMAIAKFQQALQSVLYDYSPQVPTELPVSSSFYAEISIAEALKAMSDAYRNWYQESNNEAHLRQALDCHSLIYSVDEALRRSYLYDSSKLFNLEESRDRSEQGIALAKQLYELTQDKKYLYEAFVFAERNRSSLLREAYRSTAASTLAGISAEALAEEADLKYQVGEAEEELFRLRGTDITPDSLIQQAEQTLFETRSTLDNWIKALETDNPNYYQLKYADAVPSLLELQDMLDGDQLLIEYFLGKEQLYVFTISKRGIELQELPVTQELTARILNWRSQITAYQQPGANHQKLEAAYRKEAYRLYQDLLASVLDSYNSDYSQLLIIPSGVLDLLPFEALLSAETTGGKLADYPYLLRDYTISYSYSASLQWSLQQLKRKGKGRGGFTPSFDGSGGWPSLACSERLLDKAFTRSDDQLWRQNEATTERFQALAKQYQLLHLATHAQANAEQGDFSFIVFSDGQGGYDSLFAKDLYLLDIEAELVVLSACETALGTLYNSEGVISLARAFHYAGARSVLTTLWRINESANCDLLSYFYDYLDEGEDKKTALQLAKQRYLESADSRTAHPVYWAGFQLLGNPRAVKEPMGWWLWLGVLGVVLAGGLWVRRYLGTLMEDLRHAVSGREPHTNPCNSPTE